MLKILYINHSANIGGAENVLRNIVKHSSWESLVVVPEGELADVLEEDGIAVIRSKYISPLRRKYNRLWVFKYVLKIIFGSIEICAVIKKYKPDILHANHMSSVPYCILPALLLKRKIVWHMHDIKDSKSFDGRSLAFLAKFTDTIIAVSDAVKRGLVKCGVKESLITRIWNGIDAGLSLTDASEAGGCLKKNKGILNVTQIGVVTESKGQHIFINAVKILQANVETNNKAHYYIVGEPPFKEDRYINELEASVSEMGAGLVSFVGRIKCMSRVYENTDIVVFPSLVEEAFGMVIIEAMAMGCVVIASSVGGVPEIIFDGKNGFMFSRGNSGELAHILEMIFRGKVDTADIIAEAKKTVTVKFGIEGQTAGILNVYTSLLTNAL